MRKKKALVLTIKDIIGIIIAVLAGAIIGYFGVIGSLSGAVNPTERMSIMGVISLIYFSVGAVLGLLFPRYSWKWGLFLSVPGILFLGSSLVKDYNSYFLIYIASILIFSCIGAWDGTLLRNRGKKEQSPPLKKQPKGERSKKERLQTGQTRKEQSGAGQSTAGQSKKDKAKKKQRKR
jgi:hypothetical protein